MGFKGLLRIMFQKEGSDLFLTTAAPPSMKAYGKLVPMSTQPLPHGAVKQIAYQIMTPEQIKDFEKSPEMNLAIADPDIGRFRANIFQQRDQIAIVTRNIKTDIPSQETMEHALAFAETGHLCLSTLHANNANQALDRIINFLPEERHKQLFMDMSLNLQGFVSQRLIPTVDGKRAAAIEILMGTTRVCDLIKQGKVDEIKEVMGRSENQGMKTFDSALFDLYKAGRISLEEALKNADSKNNLRLRIQLSEGKKPTGEEDDDSGLGGLSLQPKDDNGGH
jgi:Tfp pilus assembly ATPase PilU